MTIGYDRTKVQRIKNIQNKTFHCEECNHSFRDLTALNIHLAGYKHNPERYTSYKCETCNFKSRIKKAYNNHLQCKKHKKLTSLPPDIIQPEN